MKRRRRTDPVVDKRVKLMEASTPTGSMCNGLLTHFLSFFSVVDMMRHCALVCRQWTHIINSVYIKQTKIIIKASQVPPLSKSTQASHVTHLVIKSDLLIDVDVSSALTERFLSLKHLTIEGPLRASALSALSDIGSGLESLSLSHMRYPIYEDRPHNVSQDTYRKRCVKAYESLAKSPKLASLKRLEIKAYSCLFLGETYKHSTLETFLQSTALSNLTHLDLRCGYPTVEMLKEWKSGSRLPNLEHLVLDNIDTSPGEYITLLPFGKDRELAKVETALGDLSRIRPILKDVSIGGITIRGSVVDGGDLCSSSDDENDTSDFRYPSSDSSK